MDLLTLCATFYIAIFAITNPFSTIPVFVTMTANLYAKDRNAVNRITSISISVIVIVAMLVGSSILKFFGISIDAFRIAGGLMIANVAFPMLKGTLSDQRQNKAEKEQVKNANIESHESFSPSSIAIVPLAMPMMAGPGTISTAIIWANQITSVWVFLALVATLALYSLTIYILFYIGPVFAKVLGTTGLNVITRVMGLFMLSIAVQFIITASLNIMRGSGFFASWPRFPSLPSF